MVELQYGRSSEFHVEVHEKTVTLKVPDRTKFDIAWMAAKPRVIDRLRTHLHPQTVRILEEYVTPAPEKKEPAEKKGAPEGGASIEGGKPGGETATTAPTNPDTPAKTKGTKGAHSGSKGPTAPSGE